MTTSLKNVLSRIKRRSLREQNAIAKLLKEEIEWDKSFRQSQSRLDLLASEALEEHKQGKSKPLSWK